MSKVLLPLTLVLLALSTGCSVGTVTASSKHANPTMAPGFGGIHEANSSARAEERASNDRPAVHSGGHGPRDGASARCRRCF